MDHHTEKFVPKNPVVRWVEDRLPIINFVKPSFVDYPTPKNLNYWWTFGGILTFMLASQIVTGIILAMHYTPNAGLAFDSVELIKRDVVGGRTIQAIHATGASMFFVALYIHIFRGLFYGSYKAPREILWILGVIIYILTVGTAFFGYVLPWGQMSFWAAVVITNIFGAVPIIGDPILELLRGGFGVDNPTLNRFFALHYLLPFMIAGVVVLHVWALHVVGQSNPTGIEVKSKTDTVAFTPYATIKDAFGMIVFLFIFAYFIFFLPNYLGHPDNYIVANPLKTPAHIVPEWYFLPFYAILRSIDFPLLFVDSKLLGVIFFGGSILILFFVPWLDRSRVRSGNFRPLFRPFYWLFVLNFLMLMYLGSQSTTIWWVPVLGKVGVVYYFAYFLIILPLLPRFEVTRPLPASISESVLRPART